jgi:hypothetical protein
MCATDDLNSATAGHEEGDPKMKYKLSGVAAAATILVASVLGVAKAAHSTISASTTNVAIIPGFHAPKYSDTHGIPPFPASDSSLSAYHFSQVALGSVTPETLASYDTVVLYGLRWSDLSSDEQSAVNSFALTHKVIIWDADSTGAQNYDSFVHPFSTTASGEAGNAHGAVVTFPTNSPLASSDSSSSIYLDPAALVASTHLIGHMTVMNAGAADWAPALIAANTRVPNGGWVVAWAYGDTANHTGLTIYSGIDADAFTDSTTPNYAVKELAIELGMSYSDTSDTSCAPSCGAPAVPTNSSGGSSGGTGGGTSSGTGSSGGDSTSSGLGSPKAPTFAQCSLAKEPPRGWVNGRLYLSLSTSVANGIHGEVISRTGTILGRGVPTGPGHLRLPVNTHLLTNNRASKIIAFVYVNAERACAVVTQIRVDNQAPRLVKLNVHRTGHGTSVTFRASETVRLSVKLGSRVVKSVTLLGGRTMSVALPKGTHSATFLLVDRAGNRAHSRVSWR